MKTLKNCLLFIRFPHSCLFIMRSSLWYKWQSRLEDDKLVLKGRPYTVTMLNQLPDELNSFKVTSKESPSTIGFFGEINQLSNFFPASFTHEGVQYISSEQYIQASKAQYFGDNDTHLKIMGCTTSFECKTFLNRYRTYVVRQQEGVHFSLISWPKLAVSRNMAGISCSTQQ